MADDRMGSGKREAAARVFDTTPFCIDFHHHHYPPGFVEEFEGGNVPYDDHNASQRANRGAWTPATSLEEMDRNGVATAIVSVSSSWTKSEVWENDAQSARASARRWNEYGAGMVADHPGRFGLFALLPMLSVEGSLREIEYALDVLKADGFGLFTNFNSKYLGDPVFAPVWEELNRRKAVVYIHPSVLEGTAFVVPELNPATIEYGTDTTRTIASLLFSGTSSRCPDVKFIFSHAGGTMPYIIERFDNRAALPRFASALPHGLRHELTRFYYECAQSTNMGAMSSLLRLVPVSQLLFGTDFPMRKTEVHRRRLRTDCEFTEAELRAIERENGLALLPRLAG